LFRQLTASGVSFGGRGLELVSHTQCDDVVIVDSEFIIAVQLVDFIINEGVHVFVEVISQPTSI
jgi:hypothetical protein